MTSLAQHARLTLAMVGLIGVTAAPLEAKTNVPGHIVIVWHVNAREPWIGRGPDPAKLEGALMKQCTKAMQSGCKLAVSFSSGAALMGRMANGNQVLMYSKISAADARNALDAECLKQQTTCEIQREIYPPQSGDKASYEVPKITPALYRRFGAVVWSKPVSMPIRVWVAAGRATSDLARNDALANCRRDTGGDCVVAQSGADSMMLVFTEDKKGLAVVQDRTVGRAQQLLKELCLKNKVTCKIQVTIDTKVEETSVQTITL